MRALVTGAEGFAGRHLLALLARRGHDVWATTQQPAELDGAGTVRALDVTDPDRCRVVLAEAEPEVVFHLAGFAHVGQAETRPDACLAVNFSGTRNVLEAALAVAPAARVAIISSGEVYGRVAVDAGPLTEEQPLRPATVYALSKAAAELAAHQASARGLSVVILRAFNHIGPGQSPDFVASAFARQIARIEAGQQEPVLSVGNLDAIRDFTDVRDTVRAYLAAAESGRPGAVYNVTSGFALSIRQLVDGLIAVAGLDVTVEVDASRYRPLDMPILHGTGAKLARDTDCILELDLANTLVDVLDDWRARLLAEDR